MNMVYQWKQGAQVAVDPQIAGEEMERLRVRQNGRLEAKDLVRESRSPTAPLHPAFEWNDAKAADAFRVDQARYLIRSIVISVEENSDRQPIRAFVSVQRDEDRSYTSTVHALSDPELRAQVIRQAWSELEAWRQRHAELVEFARVFTEIEQARPAE